MSPTTARRAFVDAIEDGIARLLIGEQGFSLPAALLPPDAREGSWVQITVETAPDAGGDDAEQLRRRLGRGDPGGDIKL